MDQDEILLDAEERMEKAVEHFAPPLDKGSSLRPFIQNSAANLCVTALLDLKTLPAFVAPPQTEATWRLMTELSALLLVVLTDCACRNSCLTTSPGEFPGDHSATGSVSHAGVNSSALGAVDKAARKTL